MVAESEEKTLMMIDEIHERNRLVFRRHNNNTTYDMEHTAQYAGGESQLRLYVQNDHKAVTYSKSRQFEEKLTFLKPVCRTKTGPFEASYWFIQIFTHRLHV